MEKLYTVNKIKTWSWLWLRSSASHSKIQAQAKENWDNTKLARYDLNQIPCEFTVKVTNRFKGLDLVNTAPEELWTKVCNVVQQMANKIITKKRKAKRQSGYLKRLYK